MCAYTIQHPAQALEESVAPTAALVAASVVTEAEIEGSEAAEAVASTVSKNGISEAQLETNSRRGPPTCVSRTAATADPTTLHCTPW